MAARPPTRARQTEGTRYGLRVASIFMDYRLDRLQGQQSTVSRNTRRLIRAKKHGIIQSMTERRSWLTIAEAVLSRSNGPLDSREIADIALREGLILPRGVAPEYSVQAAISRDLKTGRRYLSPFVVLGSGNEIRRYWLKSRQSGQTQQTGAAR
jgi:hypothetical protein